ncbi:MAG TPA: glycosyltransferase family 39 protein, partial [Steroidobacteraceae bacterium]|nr:glycosyltransferase family 39 protein [Steroidobacteraceae bacterium]
LAGARLHGDPNPIGEAAGRDLLYHSPASYDEILTLARLGMLPFLLVLLISTWSWTRRWYGEAASLTATLFLVATPVILGHASVVALDVPVTAMSMLTLYVLLRWFEAPTWRAALCLGLSAGLAMASKISAIPFLGVSLAGLLLLRAVLLARAPLSWQLPRRIGTAAVALLLSVAVLLGMYGPRRVYLTDAQHTPSRSLDFLAGSHGVLHELAYRLAAQVPLPLGFKMVPLSILGVEFHNTHGHNSFLLGQTALNGWWYFYPVALAVKTPLPLLLLGLAGLALMAVRGWRTANLYRLAPAACFASILLFACLYSHINIGVRHVLIAYPLLAMGAGNLIVTLWQRWRSRAGHAVLAGLVLWEAATLAFTYPDYLAYFNLIGEPHPERILVDSDLDWGGQDLRRLEKVLAVRGVQQFWLGYRGTADLSREPLPHFQSLLPGQPVTGWIAITLLTLQENQAGYGWLDRYQPEHVGKSFYLYHIPGN